VRQIQLSLLCLCLLVSVPAWSQNTGCSDLPGFADFNFWIGEWEVFDNVTGNKAGENSIRPMESGCLLLESWTSIVSRQMIWDHSPQKLKETFAV